MLIILSPAKTMDMPGASPHIPAPQPLWAREASFLANMMQQYSVLELEKLLKVSDKLAEENYRRYKKFDSSDNPEKQALLAYNGSVFKEINAGSFSEEDWCYAQDHLRIISTMYGLVRPLDMIQAYRLAYSLRLKGMDGKSLYDFWQSKLTIPLIREVRKAGGVMVNLASLDVLGALKMDEVRKAVKVVTPEFQEYRHGKYETIRTYAKLARGAMTRYILLNRIVSPGILQKFEWEGFKWNEKISDEEKYIFTRPGE